MKKLLLIGSMVLVLGLLMVGFTTPIFAHGPGNGGTTPVDEEAWEAMHEACESGDWEAMAEAAEEVHGDDFEYMPYHREDAYGPSWWGGMGGHMGRGMMGW
jgi:hypothetical protein